MLEKTKSSPVDARTYYKTGNEYYEKGDYEKAIENYNMAILLSPIFSEAYFNRALSYYQLKNFEKSTKDYTKAIELDPKNPIMYNNRGDAYYRKEDFHSAIKDYDKAISLNPEYLKAYYNRGLSYASLEDYEKAIADFTKVVDLKADFAEAYHLRGLAYEYNGNLDKAVKDYEKAIEINPELEDAKTHLDAAKGKMEQSGGGTGEGGEGKSDIKMLEKPKSSFKDVAGLESTKEDIRDSIVYPMMNPELARKYGKLGGGGVLLYGPPGCGKTYIIKASAGECAAGFVNAKLSDLLDMYVGNTEKNIHKVFELGRKNVPCIIFFDEVDAIGGRRDQQQGQQYMRMAVNQLLTEMDGIESNNENVLVVAATNAPWDVDPALRRSGRFSKSLFLPEPDFVSRREILKLHAKKRPIAKGIPFTRLAMATEGYASADLKAVVDQAASFPWKEAFKEIEKRKATYISQGMSPEEAKERATKETRQRDINAGDFLNAIKKQKSSLPPWYEQAKKQIGKQEEITIIDGKEHKKVNDSKMGPGERQMFKKLLDIIDARNKWYNKIKISIVRYAGLYLPIPV